MAIKIKRKSRDPEEIPLASTADIAFLLIIFFLAASALLELKGVKLPLPKKDAPPMKIEKKNLLKLEMTKEEKFIYDNKTYELNDILTIMEEKFKQNPEIVFAIQVHPDCPSKVVPELIHGMKQKQLNKFSITIKK